MKKLLLLLLTTSLNCFANTDSGHESIRVGLGIGPMYTGMGTNISFVSQTELKYVSLGCITSTDARNSSSCGFGAGWIITDLLSTTSNKHGIGAYVSLVDNEINYFSSITTEEDNPNIKTTDVYGLGISYTFFFNGIANSGFTLGASLHATDANYTGRMGARLQFGYQF